MAIDCNKNETVLYAFLVRNELPFWDVWEQYLAGCTPGSAMVLVHSQGNAEQRQHLSTRVERYGGLIAQAETVTGDLRFSWKMLEAEMLLFRRGAQRRAANGCTPRWVHLSSERCAPVTLCTRFHAALNEQPGASALNARTEGFTVRTINDRKVTAPLPEGAAPRFHPLVKASQWKTLWMQDALSISLQEATLKQLWVSTFVPNFGIQIRLARSVQGDFAVRLPGAYDEWMWYSALARHGAKIRSHSLANRCQGCPSASLDNGPTMVAWCADASFRDQGSTCPHIDQTDGSPRAYLSADQALEACQIAHARGYFFARKFGPSPEVVRVLLKCVAGEIAQLPSPPSPPSHRWLPQRPPSPPLPPALPPTTPCSFWCVDHSLPWASKCSWTACYACADCPLPPPLLPLPPGPSLPPPLLQLLPPPAILPRLPTTASPPPPSSPPPSSPLMSLMSLMNIDMRNPPARHRIAPPPPPSAKFLARLHLIESTLPRHTHRPFWAKLMPPIVGIMILMPMPWLFLMVLQKWLERKRKRRRQTRPSEADSMEPSVRGLDRRATMNKRPTALERARRRAGGFSIIPPRLDETEDALTTSETAATEAAADEIENTAEERWVLSVYEDADRQEEQMESALRVAATSASDGLDHAEFPLALLDCGAVEDATNASIESVHQQFVVTMPLPALTLLPLLGHAEEDVGGVDTSGSAFPMVLVEQDPEQPADNVPDVYSDVPDVYSDVD